jgi:hypothetical protein
MRISSHLRIATLAVSLIAATGSFSAAYADSTNAAANQQQQQNANTGPYDGPDFVVPANNIFS